ncbi:MAG: class III poly(R)-hydroxyalkanoic acid synthase subunit PhaE [Ahniella sp.]|nr:class III poly(R)-hydroxyalkanoic acid synthase subunit PhaE [Ahniella sp.]
MGPDMMKDWQALHEQWWNALTSGATHFAEKTGQAFTGKTSGFSDLFGGKLGEDVGAATERFLSGSKQFLEWVDRFSGQIAGRNAPPKSIQDWLDAVKAAAGPMFEGSNPLTNLFKSMASSDAKGFEHFFTGLSNPLEQMGGEMKSMLGLPAFGFTRERQVWAQGLGKAWMEYQESMSAYNALMLKASQDSFARLQQKLAERERSGNKLESLRAVYDLWVDAQEDAYAEIALSAEFRAAYGELVNRQMRVRKLVQDEIERVSTQFGMPTRSELNSVHQRMAEMRRQMRALEERLAASEAPLAAEVKAAAKPAKPAKVAVKPAKTVAAKPVKAQGKTAVKKTAAKKAAASSRRRLA